SQGDLAELALIANGAVIVGEECTHVVDLRGSEEDLRARMAGASKRGARKAERLGTTVRAGGAEDFARFHPLVAESAARKGVPPTHTLEELRAIHDRFPGALALHLAENDGRLVGGVLVFRCNARAALSFYAVRAETPEASRAMDLLMERAIVLTVDLPVLGYRERDRRSGFELPPMPNVDPAAAAARGRYAGLDDQRAIGLTWDDLDEIRSWSGLPLILKGVESPEDARRAVEAGVDAIVVSNHGARQLDRALATAHALEPVVQAVGGRVPVWVDGGIRRGIDILIALALGASGVLLGRPIYWALAGGGEAGVTRALAIVREELEIALPLIGCASLADVKREIVRP
ncbi:MAG: GNAT family N-acetyltransferase, partial [Chloroflexi bacterium]|nr:GNAT family N-acetyltransferase [Chloroflexota bacterium]